LRTISKDLFGEPVWNNNNNNTWICYHQNLIHSNNFPLFDDDKPSDHIDFQGQMKRLVPIIYRTENSHEAASIERCKKIDSFMAKLKQYWSSYLPPFGIIKKEGRTVKKRVFAITTTWVMGERQQAIHSSVLVR